MSSQPPKKMFDTQLVKFILKIIEELRFLDVVNIAILISVLTFNYAIYNQIESGNLDRFFAGEQVSSGLRDGCYLTIERDNHYLYLPVGFNGKDDNNLVVMFLSENNDNLANIDFREQCRIIRNVIRQIKLDNTIH